MTIEELLQPRRKLIINYPGNIYKIGSIFTLKGGWWFNGEHGQGIDNFVMVDCNEVFKEIYWWEKRNIEDMPQYVKRIGKFNNGEVLKVADPKYNGRVWHVTGEIEHRLIFDSDITPATIHEYITYRKSL